MSLTSAGSVRRALAPCLAVAALAAGLLVATPDAATADPSAPPPSAAPAPSKAARTGVRPDSYTVNEDRVLTVKGPGVLRNDKAPRGQRYRVTRLGKVRNATARLTRKGALTLRPQAGWSGTIRTTYYAALPGGRPQRATIAVRVLPVNDAPVFTPGADQTVPFGSGEQQVLGWAAGIGPGAADERNQNVSFQTVGVANPDLFTSGGQPALAPDGTLRYTPAPMASGSSTVTVRLVDDGGTARGGANASPARTFTITVEGIEIDLPSMLMPDSGFGFAGTNITGNVLTNDMDPDDVLSVASYSIDGTPHAAGSPTVLACGPFNLNADGSWTLFATIGCFAPPTITYTTNTGSSSVLVVTVSPGLPPILPPLP